MRAPFNVATAALSHAATIRYVPGKGTLADAASLAAADALAARKWEFDSLVS